MAGRPLSIFLSATVVVAVVLLAGCEMKVDIEVPRESPAIVVNSIFAPDYRFEICLTESRDLIDGQRAIHQIDDAAIELWENDRMVEIVPYVGDCLYRSPSRRPYPGNRYTLRVTSPGYLDVEANDIAPEAVPADFEYEIDEVGLDANGVDVKITFHDPPETDNWYRLMAFHEDPTGAFFFGPPGFRTDDEAINAENQQYVDVSDNARYETVFFSDQLLDHGPNGHTIHLKVEPPITWGGPAEGVLHVSLVVVLDNISRNLHRYATSERAQREVDDNPFAEPVRIHTNVTNGYGIFGGFNRQRLVVPLF